MKFLVFIEIHVSPKCIQSVSTILFAFDIRKSIIDPNSIDPTGRSLESHNNCIDYKEKFLVQPERQLETAPTQWAQNQTPSTLSRTFIYAWHTHTHTNTLDMHFNFRHPPIDRLISSWGTDHFIFKLHFIWLSVMNQFASHFVF